MDVFDLFTSQDYTFIIIKQGANGNTVDQEFYARGIVKFRSGMNQVDNVETEEYDMSLHIRPTEPFVSQLANIMVGQGIMLTNGTYYRIVGQSDGTNQDTGLIEHYTVRCKKEEFVWDESDLSVT